MGSVDRTQGCRKTDADVGRKAVVGAVRQFKLKITSFRTTSVSGVGENG